MTNLPPPSVLLGVPGFDSWRNQQDTTFTTLMDWYHSSTRFIGVSCPTGSGKSVSAMLLAKMSGGRTVILTATKGLQEQLMRDFGSIAVLVKGQNNFSCDLYPSVTADQAPCHEGLVCRFAKNNGCAYREQVKKALSAQIVITNYAYYLAQTRFSTGLGNFDLAILDEGHQAFGALESHLTIHLNRTDLQYLDMDFPTLPPMPENSEKRAKRGVKSSEAEETVELAIPDYWGIWQSWATSLTPLLQDLVDGYTAEVTELHKEQMPVPGHLSRSYRTSKAMLAKINSLATATGDWVIQRSYHGYMFTPRWVAGYGSTLFQKVPKIMLMSAILSHKTADLLGVPQGEDRAWLEVGSYFSPDKAPMWHVPTARINYRTDDYGTTIWLARIDQLIQRRLDRKGIVFTVSYNRAKLLLENSRFKDIMITHTTDNVVAIVNKFKSLPAPAVLVSPSVTTGWDFPMLESGQGKPQYGIVGKIPYPDTQDPVTHARHLDDKDYTSYLAMEVIVQECGRLNRSSDCLSEFFFVDDNISWFLKLYGKFAPQYFLRRYKGSLPSVPEPIF